MNVRELGRERFIEVRIVVKMSLKKLVASSQDIGWEFGIEKCVMLVMKSGKRHLTEGIELPNQDKIRTLAENETYKYLGILEADIIKQV